MVFADADKAITTGIENVVGEAQVALWCQRLGLFALALPVEALIGKVAEEDGAVADEVFATAVLVHGGSHVEPFGCHVHRVAESVGAYQNHTSAFERARLEPIDVVAVDASGRQSDCAGDDQVRSNG